MEVQPGKVPLRDLVSACDPPQNPQWVRQPDLARMHRTPQLRVGFSACTLPDMHTQPHTFCPWGKRWGEERQGHPYQEALLAESHLTVSWLRQQLQQQG